MVPTSQPKMNPLKAVATQSKIEERSCQFDFFSMAGGEVVCLTDSCADSEPTEEISSVELLRLSLFSLIFAAIVSDMVLAW